MNNSKENSVSSVLTDSFIYSVSQAMFNKHERTFDKQYTNLLQDILDNGVIKTDRTGTGTKSVFGRQIRHKMSEGFPILTTKEVHFKSIVTELLWFLRGDTNIKYLVENGCNIWNGDCYNHYCNHPDTVVPLTMSQFIEEIKTNDKFLKRWGDLGPIYGKQWREWEIYNNDDEPPYKDVDQIKEIIETLKTNPDSRRMIVSAWNIPDLNKMILPPCHYGFQIYTKELSLEERFKLAKFQWPPSGLPNIGIARLDELNIPTRSISLMWNQRSVDTFLGLPFNIASYGLLLEIIAKEVNMIPDELIGNLGDTHLYLNHIEQAKEQIGDYIPREVRYEMWLTGNYIIQPTDDVIKDYEKIHPMTVKRDNALTAFGVPRRTREPFDLPKLKISHEENDPSIIDKPKYWKPTDFVLEDYKSHPKITAPLSN